MGDPWWTLIAVVVGAVAAAGGTMVIEWWKSGKELERADRELLRMNLYELQEALNVVIADYLELVTAENPYAASLTAEWKLKSNPSLHRLNMLSARVGDNPLAAHLDATHRELRNIAAQEVPEMAIEHYRKVINLRRNPVDARIGELLHLGAEVDHGPNPDS